MLEGECQALIKGSSSNLVSFEASAEYDDLTERFEKDVDLSDVRTSDDLYRKLRDWMPRH